MTSSVCNGVWTGVMEAICIQIDYNYTTLGIDL